MFISYRRKHHGTWRGSRVLPRTWNSFCTVNFLGKATPSRNLAITSWFGFTHCSIELLFFISNKGTDGCKAGVRDRERLQVTAQWCASLWSWRTCGLQRNVSIFPQWHHPSFLHPSCGSCETKKEQRILLNASDVIYAVNVEVVLCCKRARKTDHFWNLVDNYFRKVDTWPNI